ncbi:hypothetical protein K7X08_015885 [Anisodus acutangulus]|uniref:Uncharacterized protein n=1 Tax=Anisodus acutangulus TaxID=402998 RepID=A0A9Q1LCI3_9SOLA|nr:hypothetical protein K7X08_015885 [Anisodus acutangulus]
MQTPLSPFVANTAVAIPIQPFEKTEQGVALAILRESLNLKRQPWPQVSEKPCQTAAETRPQEAFNSPTDSW